MDEHRSGSDSSEPTTDEGAMGADTSEPLLEIPAPAIRITSTRTPWLHQLYPKTENSCPLLHDTTVDIVAVQGLQSKYRSTWSVETNPETGERFHWLSERLPEDIPYARVTAFEYASKWYDEQPDYTTLEECGRQLLRCLIQDRCHRRKGRICSSLRKRPIVLLGHSFGGLVIKQALILASQTPELDAQSATKNRAFLNARDILSCVAGVVFLGTPHRGTGFTRWAKLQSYFLGTVTLTPTNNELIHLLSLDSSLLPYIQSQFDKLRKASELAKLQVFCFYEKRDVSWLRTRVVTESSACLDASGSTNAGLDANHMRLNKFGNGDDPNYFAVKDALAQACEASDRVVLPRFDSRVYNALQCNTDLKEIQQWLAPSTRAQFLQRYSKAKFQSQNSYTCEWLLEKPFFRDWQTSSQRDALWIYGKPGSGKTVLSAYAVGHLQNNATGFEAHVCPANLESPTCETRRPEVTVLYFFCGVDPECETIESFLGTLIHQILTIHRDDERMTALARQYYERNHEFASTPVLFDLFKTMQELLHTIYIIVDGLEECQSYEECLHWLGRLHNDESSKTRILLSGQVSTSMSKAVQRNLNNVQQVPLVSHNISDIAQYISIRVLELVSLKPDLKSQEEMIRYRLTQGSQGMFQWVKSSIDQLLRDATPENIEQVLNDLPKELEQTWTRVFSRIKQESQLKRQKIKVALQWLCVAARPLSVLELQTALRLEDNIGGIQESDFGKNDPHADDEKFVNELDALLGTLVEINLGPDGLHYIQLTHSSLRRALLADVDSNAKGSDFQISFSAAASHRRVGLVCMQHCGGTTFALANAFGTSLLYLVKYAWEHWSYHLKHSHSDLGELVVRSRLNTMMDCVVRDATLFLFALADFVSRPFDLPSWTDEEIEHIVCFQRAQESLVHPINSMVELREHLPCGEALHTARTYYDESKHSAALQTNRRKTAIWLKEKISSFRDYWVHDATSVTSLKGEDFLNSSPLQRQIFAFAGNSLWKTAQNLRSAALRFAINPVYATLMLTAKGSTFSPIHVFVYTAALFEECGNYAYWPDLPERIDILGPFVTAPGDIQNAPARFVLHCIVYRDETSESTNKETAESGKLTKLSSSSLIPTQPDAETAAVDFSISATHKALVKKAHELPSTIFFAEMGRLSILSAEDEWVRTYVTNPLGNLHLRKKLYIATRYSGSSYLADPQATLWQYAPSAVVDSPTTELVRALPHMAGNFFMIYIRALFDQFAGISKTAFALQMAQLEGAKDSIRNLRAHALLCVNPQSGLDIVHVVCGIALYAARCRWFPSFGAVFDQHPWYEFTYCFRHAAQYLDQSGSSFWSLTFLKWLVGFSFHEFIFGIATAGSTMMNLDITRILDPVLWVLSSITTYYTLVCTERAIYVVCLALAKSIATGALMFKDTESFRKLVLFSISFWCYFIIGLVIGATRIASSAHGVGVFVFAAIFQVAAIIFVAYYGNRINDLAYGILAPIVTPIWVIIQRPMHEYWYYLRLFGILGFLYTLWRTFWMVDGWLWDPFGTQDSLVALNDACSKARATLENCKLKRIGSFPLGGLQKALPEPTVQLPPPPSAPGNQTARRDGPPRNKPPSAEPTRGEVRFDPGRDQEIPRGPWADPDEIASEQLFDTFFGPSSTKMAGLRKTFPPPPRRSSTHEKLE